MNQLVVLFALVAVACGSVVPAVFVQPAHHPALVLDPHGRPLDTAEVVAARAIHYQAKALEGHHYAPVAHAVAPVVHAVAPAVAHAYVAAPAAVSHQSRVDVHSSPAVVSHALAAPIEHSFYGAHHGHWLKKRSLGHLAYAAPVVYAAPAAVSHQSRVDVHSSPAVVHAVAPLVAAPVAYAAPAAVSHQSRVDYRTSPVVAHSYAHHVPLVHSAPLYHSAPLVHAW